MSFSFAASYISMRALLSNFGSYGDVHPILALGVELLRHGHQVIIAAAPHMESWVRRLNLEFVALGPSLQELMRSGLQNQITNPEETESFDWIYSNGAKIITSLPQVYHQLTEACRGMDVLVGGQVQPVARMVHEMTGMPYVAIHYIYVSDSQTLGNEGTPAFRKATSALINPFREQLGLATLPNPLTSDAVSEQLTLFALSRHVHPPVPGWPQHFHQPGYFFLDEEGWEPPAEALEFLSAGEKPVVITFGSMVHADAEALTELVLEAVRLAGYRAIIQRGWSGLATRKLPPRMLAVDFIPHDWLFPRSACVVHHGGAGTTASVFRAGVPSVFIPHLSDHPVWAKFAQDLGCAGPAIPYSHLTAEQLALAIARTANTPSYYRAGVALSQKIRAEQGVQKARELIEQLCGTNHK